MLLTVLGALGALFLIYYVFPALWLHLISVDDSLDSYYAAQTLVASRLCPLTPKTAPFLNPQFPGNPFRETGPPANMAKLILLRHKVLAYLLAAPHILN